MIPDQDLFTFISKYSPRVNRRPIEDFATQALGWILHRDEKLLAAMFRLCGVEEQRGHATVETQRSYEDARIDLELRDARNLILVECKVEAPVAFYGNERSDLNQVIKYQDLALGLGTRHGLRPRVVLLSKYHSTARGLDFRAAPPFVHFLWHELHSMCKARDGNPFVDQFVTFMEKSNMSLRGLNKNDPSIAKEYRPIYDAIRPLMEEALRDAGLEARNRTWKPNGEDFGCTLVGPGDIWVAVPCWGDRFGTVCCWLRPSEGEVINRLKAHGFSQSRDYPKWWVTELQAGKYLEYDPKKQSRVIGDWLKKQVEVIRDETRS